MAEIKNQFEQTVVLDDKIYFIEKEEDNELSDYCCSYAENVSQYMLDSTVEYILAHNACIYYRICYLKEKRKLIFYTDKPLTIKSVERKNSKISDKEYSDIYENLADIFENPVEYSENFVPLSLVRELLIEYVKDFDREKEIINNKVKKADHMFYLPRSNYNVVSSPYNFKLDNKYSHFSDFTVYIEGENISAQYISEYCGQTNGTSMISNLYNELLEYSKHIDKYFDFYKDNISFSTHNSYFSCLISKYDITLKYSGLEIEYKLQNSEYNFKSSEVNSKSNNVKNNINSILDKVYIYIGDCPNLIQKELIERRRNSTLNIKPIKYNKESIEKRKDLNVVESFIRNQKEIAEKQLEIEVNKQVINILNYYKRKTSNERNYTLHLDPNEIVNLDNLKEILSIYEINSITIIKLNYCPNKKYEGRVFIKIVHDKGKTIEIDSGDILYYYVLNLIYINRKSVCKSNFFTAGLKHKITEDYKCFCSEEEREVNLKHIEKVISELTRAYEFDYKINLNDEEELSRLKKGR